MKPRKFKIKELTVDNVTGIDAIALVEMPAIEIDFLKFKSSKENVTLSKVDNEKQIITGPAMIPDKMIYRYDSVTNEEYYVFFNKETVEKISQMFLIDNKQSNVNLEHQDPLTDIVLVESWLVADPSNDKATALGYSVPKGTWMVSFKVNNTAVWNKLIKTNKVKGFSIEGYFASRFNAQQTSQDEQLIQNIIDIINEPETL